jgi:hypothetical protein
VVLPIAVTAMAGVRTYISAERASSVLRYVASLEVRLGLLNEEYQQARNTNEIGPAELDQLQGRIGALEEVVRGISSASRRSAGAERPEARPSSGLPVGRRIVDEARRHIGEAFYLGVLVPLNNPNWAGPWDSANFVSWVIYQASGLIIGCEPRDPAIANCSVRFWNTLPTGARRISVDQAIGTEGAVLVRLPMPGSNVGSHIVISDGSGSTIEAKNRAAGVVLDQARSRHWDFGVVVEEIRD